MKNPCRLELNNSGSWKLLGRFDLRDVEATAKLLNAAGSLVDALNAAAGCSGRSGAALRVSTDEAHPATLQRYETGKGWVQQRAPHRHEGSVS